MTGRVVSGAASPLLAPEARVALMSIHPRFTDRILRGDKRVEWRKRRMGADVSHVLVYATAPVRKVVGWFSVAGQHTARPRELWRGFHTVAGTSWEEFDAYYGDGETGTAIIIGDVGWLAEPTELVTLGVDRAPQSFMYLSRDRWWRAQSFGTRAR